jgi:pimeloyl-ACP methyl ester carboxylesterase
MTQAINIMEVASKDLLKPIEGFKTEDQNRLVIEREVLPIIFVPGIMGSRLGRTEKDKVWDPDSTWFMFTTYGRRKANAEAKKTQLIGREFNQGHLQVLNDDAEHNAVFANDIDAARDKRGWGGVSWNSYGAILKALQEREWDQSVNLFYEFPVHAFGYNWTASNGMAGEQLAAYIEQVVKGYTDGGRKCTKVLLVTHSMGGLVARSACLLHGAKDKVLGVIHGVQPSNGSPAAYWRMKGGGERPHTIPDLEYVQWFRNPVKMFNHLKGKLVNNEFLGIGHVSAWVLGTDGEEVTALLGNMPGGLELLPNKQYKNNNGWERWLELLDKDGNEIALPIANPYREIYKQSDKYYRLVNPAWLNPGNTAATEDFENNDWNLYTKYLSVAEAFHDALARLGNYSAHPETYQFYSSGIASPDRVVFTHVDDSLWEKAKRFFGSLKKDLPSDFTSAGKSLVFKTIKGGGNPLMPVLIDTAEALAVGAVGAVIRDTDWYANRGGYRDRVGSDDKSAQKGELQLVTMQLPDGAGDGTVPESSARALKLPEDKQRTFCIADLLELEAAFVDKKAKRLKPKCKVDFDEGYFDRGHEPIFRTKSAHFITITAIENICRNEIRRVLQKG